MTPPHPYPYPHPHPHPSSSSSSSSSSSPSLSSSSPPRAKMVLPQPLLALLQHGPPPPGTPHTAQEMRELLGALQGVLGRGQASDEGMEGVRGELAAGVGPPALTHLWRRAFEAKAAEPAGFSDDECVALTVQASVASARLLRNVAAGHARTQLLLFDALSSPTLALLRLGSSLAFAPDPELQPLVRSLVQLLSNLITMNKPLQKRLFHKLGIVPGGHRAPRTDTDEAEEKVAVVQNLLASPDAATQEAVQILLLNGIKSSATNSTALAVSLGGRRLLGQLLMLFEASVAEGEGEEGTPEHHGRHASDESDGDDRDDDDDDDGGVDDFGVGELDVDIDEGAGPTTAPANKQPSQHRTRPHPRRGTSDARGNGKGHGHGHGHGHCPAAPQVTVTVGYAIFAHLFEIGLFRHLYANLAPLSESSDSGDLGDSAAPLVTTEQTLLLKTLDAWINAGAQDHTMHALSTIDQFRDLPQELVRLARFVRHALARAAQSGTPDVRIVGVHQALVLVLECLIQLGMIGCEGVENDEQFREESEELLRRMRRGGGGGGGGGESADADADASADPDVVGEIIALLQATEKYAPAISPFARSASASASATSSSPLPPGHAPTSTGLSHSHSSTAPTAAPPPRLDHLNRALIQLLGVLVFSHSPSSLPQSFRERSPLEARSEAALVRRVQDAVRERRGLLTVLGMTKVDVGNPYIRECAIFTLRYLLQGNEESQGVVARLERVGADAAGAGAGA